METGYLIGEIVASQADETKLKPASVPYTMDASQMGEGKEA